MKVPSAGKLPWLAFAILWLTYLVLGWHLSAFHFAWSIGLFLGAISLNLALTTEGYELGRLFSFGPRSILTILLLSGTVTLAFAAAAVFALLLILLASKLLTRVEMQICGFSNRTAFWALSIISTLGLAGGWLFGTLVFQSSNFWIGN